MGPPTADTLAAACLKHQLLAFSHAVAAFQARDGARQLAALALVPDGALARAAVDMEALWPSGALLGNGGSS